MQMSARRLLPLPVAMPVVAPAAALAGAAGESASSAGDGGDGGVCGEERTSTCVCLGFQTIIKSRRSLLLSVFRFPASDPPTSK